MTDDTAYGTPTSLDEKVSRDIGQECNLDAADIAESVDGARADLSLEGSAITKVDSEHRC